MKITKRTKVATLVAATVLILGGVAFWTLPKKPEPKDDPASERARRRLVRRQRRIDKAPDAAVREAMKGVKLRKRQKKAEKPFSYDTLFPHLKGKDRKIAQDLQKALDADDYAGVVALSKDALASANPEVRENAVDALGWFGAEALPELTTCMADPDEEVAQSAMNQWEVALAEIEDSSQRVAIAAASLFTIADKEALDSISGQFSISATEYIDDEEDPQKASLHRVEVVQTLLDLIESGNKDRARIGREMYEDITGNTWRNADEAEAYLRDPENYEDPVEDDPDADDDDDDGDSEE